MISTLFRGGEGQFFTPRNIVQMMIDVLQPTSGERIIDLASFDLILANPPFGAKIPIIGEDILKQYELGHVWQENTHSNNTNENKTNKI